MGIDRTSINFLRELKIPIWRDVFDFYTYKVGVKRERLELRNPFKLIHIKFFLVQGNLLVTNMEKNFFSIMCVKRY